LRFNDKEKVLKYFPGYSAKVLPSKQYMIDVVNVFLFQLLLTCLRHWNLD